MTGRFHGRVALVTGGTSGIGAGAVERLAAEGAVVHFTGSKAEAGEALAARTGGMFHAHRVEDAEGWPPLIEAILARHGRLDIAFANAGTEAGDASVEDIRLEAWHHVMGVNLTGAMLTVQHAIRAMRQNPEGPAGAIILNSSMNAHRAMGNYVAYSVSKSGMCALAKSAALHCATSGTAIRVNAILPGVVETALIAEVIARSPDPAAARAAFEAMSPMKRMASVEDVTGLVAFLASDEARHINGAELVIDGASTAGMMGV
ncbi:SDR family NAD(P)-dependent oxidoreductase [Thermaurantiacus sp.]